MPNLLSKLSPRGRWKKWLASVFAILLIGYGIYFIVDLLEPERVLVTISKETTYITEPLKKSGYPDYIATLNKIQSEGVTTENNILIPLIQAAGPQEIASSKHVTEGMMAEYFKMLDIEQVPNRGMYLERFDQYVDRLPIEQLGPLTDEEKAKEEYERLTAVRKRLNDRYDEAIDQLNWIPEKNPIAEKWLAEQESILERLNGLELRTRYYAPYQTEGPDALLVTMNLDHVTIARNVAYALQARAIRSLGNKQYTQAWNDCKKILRIADGLYQCPTLVEQLVGAAVQSIADQNLLNMIVQRPDISLAELEEIEKYYNAISPIRFDHAMQYGERFWFLDAAVRGAEFGLDPKSSKTATARLPFRQRKKLDYDVILRDGNQFYDQAAKFFETSDRQEQKKIADQLYERAESERTEWRSGRTFAEFQYNFTMTRYSRSKLVSSVLLDLFHPATHAAMIPVEKTRLKRELHNIGFAMVRYHKKHGKYPLDFAELKSEGITKTPYDYFAEKPCKYSSDGQGFLLYGIGFDQKDHQGFGRVSSYYGDCDDIAIFSLNRTPQPPPVPMEDSEPASPPMTEEPAAKPNEK